MKKLELFPKVGRNYTINNGVSLWDLCLQHISHHVWFTGSLVLYIIIETLMIGIVDRKLKPVVPIVMNAEGEEIPNEFKDFSKSTASAQIIVHVLALIIITLMTVKPF